MLYNRNQIEQLISKYDTLLEYVEDYVREKYPNDRRGDVRFKWGVIEEYVNTSCHCHPEYEWVDRGSVQDFSEWITSKNEKYTTKHYSKK